MSRYIDADAYKNVLEKLRQRGIFPKSSDVKILRNYLDEFPTADVVEVVRCNDCEFWQNDWIPNTGGDRGCHYCEMMDSFTEPLNYCGYGRKERK